MKDRAVAARAVQFAVRIRDDAALEVVGRRVDEALQIRLLPYTSKFFDGVVLSTVVLGIRISLVRVDSLQADAPQRYQLQGLQQPDDRTRYTAYNDIDDYILHVLERHEPGRWYRPTEREARIDAGIDVGRIQDEV